MDWRKLHSKILDSKDFNGLPTDFDRLVWVLIPLVLDREGRGIDDSVWLKSRLFPMRRDVTYEQIESSMTEFAHKGMIERYKVSEEAYFSVPTWSKYQTIHPRETASAIPPKPNNSRAKRKNQDSESKANLRQALGQPKDVPDKNRIEENRQDSSPDGESDGNLSISKREALAQVEDFFATESGISKPDADNATEKQKRGLAVRWWNPLRSILKQTDYDIGKANAMIRHAIRYMRENKLTLSAPQSIEQVVISECAKRNGASQPGHAMKSFN